MKPPALAVGPWIWKCRTSTYHSLHVNTFCQIELVEGTFSSCPLPNKSHMHGLVLTSSSGLTQLADRNSHWLLRQA